MVEKIERDPKTMWLYAINNQVDSNNKMKLMETFQGIESFCGKAPRLLN